MIKVFVLEHVREDEDSQDVKLIGVFSIRVNAELAIEKLANSPGFRDCLDGFTIDEYVLDEIEWSEGFGV